MDHYFVIPLFVSLLTLALGFFVYSKSQTSKVNKAFFIICLTIWMWLFMSAVAYFLDDKAKSSFWMQLAYMGVVLTPFSYYFFTSRFLRIDNTVKEKHFIYIGLLLTIIFEILLLTTDLLISGTRRLFWGYYPYVGKLHPIYMVFFMIYFSRMLFMLSFKYLKKKNELSPLELVRLKYVLAASIFSTFGIIDFIPNYGIEIYPFGYVAVVLFAATVGYAIMRHQLMDINVVIRKTLVYSILISILTILYLITIYALERIFSGIVGYRSIASAIMIISLFSLLFIPLKNKIQRYIDKYFFKGSIDQIDKERTLLETELYKADRLKALSTLAAGMAHEIKNPLTSIKTFVEYVDKKHLDPAFRAKFKDIVPNEIDKITNIVNQLLDYSRTEKTSQKECNIHNILNYVLELYNNVFLKKHIKLTKLYNSKAPDMLCEENKIKQAFINIIMNSIEAMPDGGSITVKTEDIDNAIEISIKDTGTGIAEEHIKRLFDPFYTTKEKGTGLGLFIVHQIIQNNKGKIVIESEMNKGTRVKIRLEKSEKG